MAIEPRAPSADITIKFCGGRSKSCKTSRCGDTENGDKGAPITVVSDLNVQPRRVRDDFQILRVDEEPGVPRPVLILVPQTEFDLAEVLIRGEEL